jgi:hypothetical protein
MSFRRSILAIGSALAAALLTQRALSAAVQLLSPTLNAAHLQGGALTAALVGAYLLGTISTAVAAGITLGRLAPGNPSLHVAAVAGLSPLIGYILSGSSALPHGWQLVGYGLQLILIELITLAVFHGRVGPTAGLSTRPA